MKNTKVLIGISLVVGLLVGTIGASMYAAANVDRLVMKGTKFAWSQVEDKVAVRALEIKEESDTKIAALQASFKGCAAKESSVVLNKLKGFAGKFKRVE